MDSRTGIGTHTHKHILNYTHARTHIHIYIYTYIYTHTRTHTHAHSRTYAYVYAYLEPGISAAIQRGHDIHRRQDQSQAKLFMLYNPALETSRQHSTHHRGKNKKRIYVCDVERAVLTEGLCIFQKGFGATLYPSGNKKLLCTVEITQELSQTWNQRLARLSKNNVSTL